MNYISILRYTLLCGFWYFFNAACNVYLMKIKEFQYPITVSAIQLGVGFFYIIPLWVLRLRKPPRLSFQDILHLVPIACMNLFANSITIAAIFQKGGGSFTHVIKASEPVVCVILNFLVNGIIPNPLTALNLLPISYGVAYASTLGDLTLTMMMKELLGPIAIRAICGNTAIAYRAIQRKNLSEEFKTRTNLTPENDNAVVTIISFVISLPFIAYFEPIHEMLPTYQHLPHPTLFLQNAFCMGMSFCLYNELQNILLQSFGPVTTAVGNTFKRVVIFVAFYFFTEGETFPIPKIVGCVIAMVGCLLYAIFDSKKL